MSIPNIPASYAFNEDDWGCVINGPNTYASIAAGIRAYGAVLINWTDESGTVYDILLAHHYLKHGEIQGGLNHRNVLMVAIVRKGCFGFDVASRADLHHEYISEKLFVPRDSETALKLADLIMGVRKILSGS